MSKKRIKALEKENKELRELLVTVKEQLEQLKEEVNNINPEIHHHHYGINTCPPGPPNPPYEITCNKGTGNPYTQEPSTTEPIQFLKNSTFDSLTISNYIDALQKN